MGSYATTGQAYAQLADLYQVISAAALTHPSTGTTAQNAQLLRASEELDGYFRARYQLPLATWGSDVVHKTCDIAAYRLVCLRGFNPEKDGHYLDNYNTAVQWARDVSKGFVSPDVKDASTNTNIGESAPPAEPTAYSPNRCTRGTNRR